jgi:predicted dehydrogenase
MDDRLITRRQLFGQGMATCLGLVGSGAVPLRRVAPSERITIGFIGAGNIANAHVWPMVAQPDTQVVAICDVQDQRCAAMVNGVNARYGRSVCRGYRDFRELLARPDIDAVFVCTPDNWHALQVIEAARQGKHCYSEKPLSRTLAEGLAMREAVRRYGIVFQHGTQQRSDRWFRYACELVRNGAIGKVHTVRVAVVGNEARGWGHPTQPPSDIDWDMWLGPAPWAPYSPERIQNLHWYFIEDYSAGGYISGWGIHHVDIAQWGLGMDDSGPVSFEGTGVFAPDGMTDTPITWHVECRYANGVRMVFTTLNEADFGVTFEGEKGTVFVDRGRFWTRPESIGKERIPPDGVRLVQSDNHHRNFLDCIRSRRDPVAPIEAGLRSQTICCLSDIAIRLGRKIRWDPRAEKVVGDPEAARQLTRAMRSPWRI